MSDVLQGANTPAVVEVSLLEAAGCYLARCPCGNHTSRSSGISPALRDSVMAGVERHAADTHHATVAWRA